MAENSIAAGLVDDDVKNGLFRVNRRAFVDPAILDEEKRRVFAQAWLYVGHESEIRDNGSFVARRVAGRPVFMVRDDSGRVNVFFDTCPHRGNAICVQPAGNAKRFTCFYHGWTFNTRGELIGVPDEAGYSPAFDKKNYHLAAPPRVESYRGLVFMSLKADIVDLVKYFGGVRDYLDLFLDYAEELEATPGQQSYSMRANWKLLVENSIDGYHGLITHSRYFIDYLRDLGGDPRSWQSLTRPMDENAGFALGNGHAVIEYPVGGLPISEKGAEHLKEVRAGLEKRLGADRTRRILDISRNIFIYPNFAIVHHFRTIRTFYPVAPDYMEINAWGLMPKDEPREIRRLRHDNFISFLGPGGFGTPDDVEALENCQRGFAATELAWSDISRGMKRKAIPSDEAQMRSFWRRWYQAMNPAYTPGAEEFPQTPSPAAAKAMQSA
jgi:p-cumate 2,3-dioxygenase alpha subunit